MTQEDEMQQMSYVNPNYFMGPPISIGSFIDNYFSLSPFYESTCLNSQAKGRGQEIEDVQHMVGFYYKITYVENQNFDVNGNLIDKEPMILSGDEIYSNENKGKPLQSFAEICKFENFVQDEGNVETRLLAKYYFIYGTIFKSPDLSSLLTSQLRSAIFHLREAIRDMEKINEWKPEFGFHQKGADTLDEPPFAFDVDEFRSLMEENNRERDIQGNLIK